LIRALLVLPLVASLTAASLPQGLSEQRAALRRAEDAGRTAAARASQLAAQADAAHEASARASAAAVAVAARIQSSEADIATAEARIRLVEDLRRQQRARLAAKQGPTARLVAALETMARRPPALALVQPGSIADLVHVHAVLAGVTPVLNARTAALRADIERGRQLRLASDAALAARRQAQQRLVAEQAQLAALSARKRAASIELASSAMSEQDRAIAMGEEARDIGDLVSRIDASAAIADRLASLPGPILRPERLVEARALPSDRAAFTPTIPAYRLPVVGEVVTGMGEVSDTGIRARGLTIATRPSAQVVAPTSGRIAFAGLFRGYGNIIVIDHGLGWTTLITSLAALDVRTGDPVDRGSPLGRAGSDRPTVTVELRRRGQPVDIAKIAG